MPNPRHGKLSKKQEQDWDREEPLGNGRFDRPLLSPTRGAPLKIGLGQTVLAYQHLQRVLPHEHNYNLPERSECLQSSQAVREFTFLTLILYYHHVGNHCIGDSSQIEQALCTLGGGTCYFPGCDHPIIRYIENVPVAAVELAHIRETNPGSPRYDRELEQDTYASFSNLILVCTAHRLWLDKLSPEPYSIAELQAWKNEHAKKHGPAGHLLNVISEKELTERIELALSNSSPLVSASVELSLGMASLDHLIELSPEGFAEFVQSHPEFGKAVVMVRAKNDGSIPLRILSCSLEIKPSGTSLDAADWSSLFGPKFPCLLRSGESDKWTFNAESITTVIHLLESQGLPVDNIVAEAILDSGGKVSSSPMPAAALRD